MLKELDITLEPYVSAGNVVTWALIAGMALVWWIRGAPDRKRAANEEKALDHSEAAKLRAEFNDLHKLDRKDIHDLRNRLAEVTLQQGKCEKSLSSAHAENRTYRDDMGTLLFLIRLLISEVKRLDKEPGNAIIRQAEMVLSELERTRGAAARQGITSTADAADRAVTAAEHSLDAAHATATEVKAEEGK